MRGPSHSRLLEEAASFFRGASRDPAPLHRTTGENNEEGGKLPAAAHIGTADPPWEVSLVWSDHLGTTRVVSSITADRVIRLVPPLILSAAEAEQIVAILCPLIKDFLREPA